MQPISQLSLDDAAYPASLRALMGQMAPAHLQWSGHEALFHVPKLALFCSVHCPGSALSKAFDLANVLRQNLIAVMSGFHSPVEKEWFTLLQRSATPLISCPARSLDKRRLSAEERSLLGQRRLLLLNFGFAGRRPTREDALVRNLCMAAFAEIVVVAYAAPGSMSAYLCQMAVRWQKRVYTFADPEHAHEAPAGVAFLDVKEVPEWFAVKGIISAP